MVNKPYVLSSSWESIYARYLDIDPDVIAWSYEAVHIFLPTGAMYITDFLVQRIDGSTDLVEVKPVKKIEMNLQKAEDKLLILALYCRAVGWNPVVVTENEMEEIAKMISDAMPE